MQICYNCNAADAPRIVSEARVPPPPYKPDPAVIGGGGVMTTAPEWRIWTENSQKFNLNFIALPEDLLGKLARDGEQERGMIPAGLYRGIERPIPAVVRTGTVIYGRADMPEDFAYLVAKAMDQ